MLRFRASDFPRTLRRSLRRTGLAVVLRELCAECAGALRGFFGDSPGTFRKLSEQYLGTFRGVSEDSPGLSGSLQGLWELSGNFPARALSVGTLAGTPRTLGGLSWDALQDLLGTPTTRLRGQSSKFPSGTLYGLWTLRGLSGKSLWRLFGGSFQVRALSVDSEIRKSPGTDSPGRPVTLSGTFWYSAGAVLGLRVEGRGSRVEG